MKSARSRSRVRRLLLATLGCAALAGNTLASGSVQPLAEDIVLEVQGGGWGHGHGLAQYGARAQANAGRGWRDILSTYYTGVAIETRDPRAVRVLIDASGAIVVGGELGYTARWSDGTLLAERDPAAPYLRAAAGTSGIEVAASASREGPWRAIASGVLDLRIEPGETFLQHHEPDGEVRYYRGRIEMVRRSETLLYGVNELPMREYLYGVVPREMPALWPAEALQAQAVAARTYAAFKQARATGPYDLCKTTACQAYGGYARRPSPQASLIVLEHPNSNDAVDATEGVVLTHEGSPIFAEYSSSSGGYTARGSVPALAPVPDPWDESSPLHRWTARVSVREIQDRWPAIGRLASIRDVARDGFGPWGGRVRSMTLVGTQASVGVSGSSFWSAFAWPGRAEGVRSELFTISVPEPEAPEPAAPSPTPEPAPPPKTPSVIPSPGTGVTARRMPVLRAGSRGRAVSDLQGSLRAARLYRGRIDGIFGRGTRAAVVRFQRARHLQADGIVGRLTWAALPAAAPTTPSTSPSRGAKDTSKKPVLRAGSRGRAVSDLQGSLRAARLYRGRIDGIFGRGTRAAVVRFQRARHLQADGIVGRLTWAALPR